MGCESTGRRLPWKRTSVLLNSASNYGTQNKCRDVVSAWEILYRSMK